MAAEMLILSSSPPRQLATFNLSSSPLPSMDEILQKRPQVLRTGSGAAPIPRNASASFTTAATLLKSASSLKSIYDIPLDDDAGAAVKPAKPAKTTKPRKAPVKKAEDESKPAKKAKKPAATDEDTEVAEKKKPRSRAKKVVDDASKSLEKQTKVSKPRAKKAAKENAGTEAKEKPARKPRVKKAEGESQTKLTKGKVTKASTTVGERLDNISKLLEVKTTESQELDIPKALKRRVDWTPPVPAGKTIDVAALEGVLSSGGLESGQKPSGFANLFGNYGFTKLETNNAPVPLGTEITRKRKLADLIKTNVTDAAAVSPKVKEKAPKKKARTITDQATSAYAEEEELPGESAPLLQYFSLQASERSTKDGFKIPAKPRAKSPVKGNFKAKKGSAQAPILLSPESAMKQVGKQDFVFGTSSQLAREDSPTFLRDIHAAMQASNQEDDPFADSIFDSSPPVVERRTGINAKRNLWSAASRDDSGELLDVPMIDLVDSPAVQNQDLELPATTITPLHAESDIWHDIGTTPAAKADCDTPKKLGLIEAAIREEILGSPSGNRGTKSPKTTKPAKVNDGTLETKSPAKSPAKAAAKGKKQANTRMPNFASYTDAQLAKEIASYKFKPIKKREQMIVLLQRCWEGKNQPAPPTLGSLSTNLPIVPNKPTKGMVAANKEPGLSPNRPRGRPRKEPTVQYLEMESDMPLAQARTPKKSKTKAKEMTEDISDSDSPLTPSPPRRSPSKFSPLPLRAPASDLSDSLELSPGAAQELLFKHISRAVTSAPRSKDPLNPSWHEKILLYDPIVLEDLTIWLNSGRLDTVGCDYVVDAKVVKKWCESKSICCLWRENLQGRARNRY